MAPQSAAGPGSSGRSGAGVGTPAGPARRASVAGAAPRSNSATAAARASASTSALTSPALVPHNAAAAAALGGKGGGVGAACRGKGAGPAGGGLSGSRRFKPVARERAREASVAPSGGIAPTPPSGSPHGVVVAPGVASAAVVAVKATRARVAEPPHAPGIQRLQEPPDGEGGGHVEPSDPSLSTLNMQERENAVAKFFREAPPSSSAAASLLTAGPRMDVAQYYEKRRVQTGLRRLLESLQELFLIEVDAQASDLSPIFDALCATRAAAGCRSAASATASGRMCEGVALTEMQLCGAIEELSGWPPELTPGDRLEICSAILVPSLASARARLEGQQTPRQLVTRHAFCDGLDRVPFNLPDFPVPAHVLHPGLLPQTPQAFVRGQIESVAKAVAATFCMDRTGSDRVKDFFLSGLLSLEEVQRALPKLVPYALVEDAVALIVRCAAPVFTPEEWEELVVTLRNLAARAASSAAIGDVPSSAHASGDLDDASQRSAPASSPQAQAQTPRGNTNGAALPTLADAPPDCVVSLDSPAGEKRPVDAGSSAPAPSMLPGGFAPAEPHERFDREAHGEALEAPCDGGMVYEASEQPRPRDKFQAVTEPLPCRELRSEEPVRFHAAVNGSPLIPASEATPPGFGGATRVVDWSTATARRPGASNGSSHQADQSAGARPTWGTSGFRQELALKAAVVVAAAGADEDYLAWINLGLHNECAGPYLARAFVLCCQLYERQRMGQREPTIDQPRR